MDNIIFNYLQIASKKTCLMQVLLMIRSPNACDQVFPIL